MLTFVHTYTHKHTSLSLTYTYTPFHTNCYSLIYGFRHTQKSTLSHKLNAHLHSLTNTLSHKLTYTNAHFYTITPQCTSHSLIHSFTHNRLNEHFRHFLTKTHSVMHTHTNANIHPDTLSH